MNPGVLERVVVRFVQHPLPPPPLSLGESAGLYPASAGSTPDGGSNRQLSEVFPRCPRGFAVVYAASDLEVTLHEERSMAQLILSVARL